MTFTFIIMDSLYIMRNLLMIFYLMVVFWTNLGNCEGSCDRYTQCYYNETRIHSTVSCYIEKDRGDTAPPCYGDGSSITCSCNSEKYQLSSPNNSYLCRPDKWEDGLHDLHCLTALPCDEPAPPDDLVFHNPDFAEGEMYPNGTEIMYDCPDGWDLNGHMTAVCINGVWTYEDAHCTALPCDEPAPPDDKVFHFPDSAQGEMYPNGTEIMYNCPDGWDLNGHMTAVCLYGVWTNEDAYCTASPCDEPAPPDDLVLHSPDFAEGEMYANGTEVMYDCPDRFDLNGDMTAVCLYGVWTYENAYCTASPCDEPAPPDDLVIHSPDFAEGEIYANGTEIIYDCPDGWDFNGNMTAVCLHGVWTYENAFCTAIPCDEPAPPDDKVFHSPDFAQGEMYPNGTEIMYYCPDGFDLNGNRIAVCLYGVWTYEDAYCTDSPCKDPAPANVDVIVTPQNGEDEGKSGSRVSYSCPNGFILHGSRSAVCLCGRWIVRTVPSCSAVCSKSTDCKSEQISACDIRTRSCACPPGKTFQNEKCLVERIIKSSLQLEVAYKEDFRKKSSCTFLSLEQEICKALEEMFTRLDDKFNNKFVSCEVEAIRKLDVDILADVVTRYDEDVAAVTPKYFATHIQSEAQSGLHLIWIPSKVNTEESYNACKEKTDICDPENGYCIYHSGTNYECRCKIFTTDRNRGNPALHGIECDPFPFLLVIIIATYTLLFAVLLIWLVKKHCLRRGTKWIPSVEGVANEQVPPTANDESKFVSKVTFEMRDPNAYQNDVNKEENDVTDHVGDNSPDDSPNNDPEEETV